MDRRLLTGAGFLVVAVLVTLAILFGTGLAYELAAPDEYDRTTVTVRDANGTRLATVEARVADSFAARYVGLSDTDSLPDGEGMLFVHGGEGEQTYVMRGMSFPLDIVFIGAEGRITTIHHAPTPEETPESDLRRYSGRAKWVLEVPRGWTNATGVDEGDRIDTPPVAAAS